MKNHTTLKVLGILASGVLFHTCVQPLLETCTVYLQNQVNARNMLLEKDMKEAMGEAEEETYCENTVAMGFQIPSEESYDDEEWEEE